MSLEAQINDDIRAAMLGREKDRLEALRAVKAAILLEKTSATGSDHLPEEVEIKLLQRLVKQRRESADIYREKGRNDLADIEMFQVSVIEKYLPGQMGADQIRELVSVIIKETGAAGPGDMGKVMGVAAKRFAGQADNKTIAGIVKELLQ